MAVPRCLALAALACILPLSARAQAPPAYDIVIRNGHIIDGTGSPWYAGDLAIRDGRIAAIASAGTIPSSSARTTIEAHGMVVAPGFIDMLGQSERKILTIPHVPSKLYQGITTEITGEGNSIAPRSDAMIAAELASVPSDTPAPEFHTLREYFARLETQGAAINLGTYVGAATARRVVLGDADRAPSADELTRMQAVVRDAMRDGAMGVSTSLMYAPGVYARTPELIALAKAASASGGIYATHIRSESNGVVQSVDEAIRIGREAHIPVEIFHLKAAGKENWGRMPELVRHIEAARAEGLDVTADTYAYTLSGNPASALIPPWAHDGGDKAMVARFRDPAMRVKIHDSIQHDRTWDNEWFMIQGPEGVILSSSHVAEIKPLLGQTLAQVAAARNEDPVDCAMDLLIQDPRLGVLLATMSEDDVTYALKQPWVSVGLDGPGTSTDDPQGGRHPRAYATFSHILRKYVREDNLITLPDAIRKFTALPAGRLHLADRGVLKAGMWADVVIFDPARVRDAATFEHPTQYSEGMEWVLVNGVPVLADGKLTDALPGKVLRGPGYRP